MKEKYVRSPEQIERKREYERRRYATDPEYRAKRIEYAARKLRAPEQTEREEPPGTSVSSETKRQAVKQTLRAAMKLFQDLTAEIGEMDDCACALDIASEVRWKLQQAEDAL